MPVPISAKNSTAVFLPAHRFNSGDILLHMNKRDFEAKRS
jgi:hypothetical protein